MHTKNKQNYFKKLLSLKVSFLLAMYPVMAAEIVVDTARTYQNTSLDTAANGTSVVNISTPNTNGVSHNTYIQFNVPTQGTILNNSDREIQTQLAGYIYGNENVRNGSASLILNEVSGTNRSRLNGYLEVAGQSADVIVANPNGITVNGAGFINIPKATLTTGKVSFSGQKPIYDIEGGDIFIDGKGLDASGTSSLELYTQAIKLNASLHANDLSAVTGLNHIDENGEVTSNDSDGKERPAFSIDSTVLGGIYANAISLIGTQKGVGVNIPSEMLVQDRLELSSDGKIILGKVSVKNRAKIRSNSSSIEINDGVHASSIDLQASTDIALNGNLGATETLTLHGNNLYNDGLLAAGVNDDFTEAEDGLLNLTFVDSITNKGVFHSLNNMTIDTKHFINTDQGEVTTQTLLLDTTQSLENNGKLISNVTTLNTQTLSNSGLIHTKELLDITADSIDNSAGVIESLGTVELNIENRLRNNDGMLFAEHGLSLAAVHLDNTDGSIQSNKTLTIDTSGDLDNTRGVINSGTGTTITAQTLNNEEGFIGSLKTVFLDLFNFEGDNGAVLGEEVDIHTTNMYHNNITVQATGGLSINADADVELSNASVLSDEGFMINAQTLNLHNTLLYAQDTGTVNTNLFNNSDGMVSSAQMYINTGTFNNTDSQFYFIGDTAQIYSSNTLNNSNGLISANGTLILDAENLDNQNGDLEARDRLEIRSNNVQIEGSRFFAGDHLSMTSNISSIDADTKFLSSNTMDLDFAGNLVHHGEILANGTANINVDGNLDNESSITANDSLNIRANTLNNNMNNTGASIRGGNLSTFILNGNLNNYGFITSSGSLDVSAQEIHNHAGISSAYDLTLRSMNVYNYNTLVSGNDMNLFTTDLLRNHEDADIYAGNALTISKDDVGNRTGKVENISGKIESKGDMSILAMDISNISATEITTTLQEVNGLIDIRCDIWESFSCPALALPLEIDLMAIKTEIIQEYRDNGVTLSMNELQDLLTEEMIKGDREAYILNMYKDTKTTSDTLYFYELTASLDSNEMIVKRTKPHKKEEFRKIEYTVSKEVVDAVSLDHHKEGEIVSGHNLLLDADNVLNRTSLITANNDLEINGNLKNIGVSSTEFIDATINYSWKRKGDGGKGQLPISKFEIRDVEGVPSQILAGGTLSGNFGVLQNGMRSDVDVTIDPNAPTISTSTQTTDDTQETASNATVEAYIQEVNDNRLLSSNLSIYDPSLEGITLPNNPYGIFITNPNPEGPLIESNPEYTHYNNFVSSDYMLERLGYDGSSQTRRLGDAMYETQLIRDAIISMTGQRYIGTVQNDNDQYIQLMNAGVDYAQEVGLQLGVSPTLEQLKELKDDLIWMEVKVIEGKEVLVPVLYLANEYTKLTDANIHADHMDLTVDGHLVNVGNIQSRQDMALRTGTLTNAKGKIESGSNMLISAIGDLKNLSAKIKGGAVYLTSDQGSIINKTLSKDIEAQHSVGEEKYTFIDKRATIEATKGHLVLDATKQIENIGADMDAKAGMVLKAKENVDIRTLKDERSYDYAFSNGYAKGESVEHVQSSINTGGQLAVLSDKDINLEASNIKAADTYLQAKEKVNAIAVVDSKFSQSYFEEDGVLSSSTKSDMKLMQTVKGTEIQTGNLHAEGSRDVTLESIRVNADQSAQITSKTGNVNFTSKAYTNAEHHEESSSMLGGLISERSVDAITQTKLSDSSAKAENSIIVDGKDINIIATDIKSQNGGIKLTASENVNIVSGMESKSEVHIREESGLNLGLSDGRLTVAKETIDSIKTTRYINKASNIEANQLLIKSGKDTNVIASDITAGEMLVDAGRDFNVLSDKDITAKHEEHTKKEIGIEVTLNSQEASVFTGYWEDKQKINSRQSEVVSSSIKTRNLDVNSKNTNVVGSHISGEAIAINSENIRILSDSTNSDIDVYTKSIKAGVEVGVKQNLSNVVDGVKSIGESESASAVAARGLKAYDALQSFSEQPVTAGVNAIYEETNTDTHSKNSQVVASSITATNSLILDAKEALEVSGSDIGSANALTIDANDINIHASEGIYTTESSSESKNGSVGLYGTRMGQTTLAYQENEIKTKGTYHRNSQIYAGGTANITSKEDTTLSGVNIEAADLALNVGGDLNMQSLQDTQTIEGSSKGGSISGGLTGLSGMSSNAGETTGEKAWVSQATSINANESVTVNVGGTATLTGVSITNIDESGVDQGNLAVSTQHLVIQDIKDMDTYDATIVGTGVGSNDGAPSLNSVEYTNNTTDKEQITRATIGRGSINTQTTTGIINRDISISQEIIRDEESNTELYVSDRSLALLDDPTQSIHNLKNKLKDVGHTAYIEVLENLPSESKGADGQGDFIDNTIGVVLDATTDAGIIPTVGNSGGYVTQIATQLFGDNRTGFSVEEKSKIENLTTIDGEKLKERQVGDKTTDWDYEKITLVKTDDGIKPIADVENTEGLEIVTKYRTNPHKHVIIEDGSDQSGNAANDTYKIRISKENIQNSGIKHLFTNGMFNDHDTAVYNQHTQQNGADAVLNYNQMHGVLGDMIENVQDHLVINGSKVLKDVFTDGGSNTVLDSLSYLGTGGSRQTGNLINQMTTIRNGDLTTGAHSQGTLMTQNGLTQHKAAVGKIVQGNINADFLLQYSGAPVNHKIAANTMTEIYGGKEKIDERFTNEDGIANVFRSQVAPEDFVGSVLGYQSAGINNSENLGENMKESTLAVGRLFGVGGSSTHSYYGCVIGCGNENYTPDIKNYVNPDKTSESKELPIEHYYEKNFAIQDSNGQEHIDINLELLPGVNKDINSENKEEIILDIVGGNL